MNGITYYRLKSDYVGDYTKNCALNGSEVDNNFYVLEGRDIKSIAVKDKDIVVTLFNGDVVSAKGAFDLDFVTPTDTASCVVGAHFDDVNGILTLTNMDGTKQVLEGFSTTSVKDFKVSTDNTIIGNGLRYAPLGVAPSAKTGQFKTVKSLIDVAAGGSLPEKHNAVGDRYVTCEKVSDYGYLYDYNAVREIASELKKTGWRIPTKEDWDDLLNSIEPCEGDKNHDKSDKNAFLGKFAGKLLKSKTMWKTFCDHDDCCDDCCHEEKSCGCVRKCDCGKETCFDYSDDKCTLTNECHKECKCCDDKKDKYIGLDSFGFRVTPAGYYDDGCTCVHFKERAEFWTATTNESETKAYIKRFQWNKNGVYQDVVGSNFQLSLRLVKDFNGSNYHDAEEILDMEYPTLLLPSIAHGKSIWTSANLAYANPSVKHSLPNKGEGLTYTMHYFINEWNGFKWVRNEMKQGDSVVIAKAPKGKEMVEYRVIGDEFVSVNEMIYNDVVADIQPKFDDIQDQLDGERIERKAEDKNLKDQIDLETAAREEVDEALKEVIDDLSDSFKEEEQARKEADETLNAAIENEKQERIASDTSLNETIATVNTNLVSAINEINKNVADGFNTINSAIETERQIRSNADDALQANIDEEAKRAKQAEEDLQTKLDEEAKTREEADANIHQTMADNINVLNTAIKTVNDNLVEAITTINGGIEAERQIREEKDTELQEATKTIEGKLLTQDGTAFDTNTGKLTLKSAEGTNDITVNLAFNFGEF